MLDGAPPPRGCWTITHIDSGYSTGTYHGAKANAIKLAKIWDPYWADVNMYNAKDWPLARQWVEQLTNPNVHAPLHGPVESPNCHPGRPHTVQLALDARRQVRCMAGGQDWEMHWLGKWHPLPTMEELEHWTLDSVCERPDGAIVEPDHPESWLSLLRLI